MRVEDWPERLARYVRARTEDVGGAAWVAGWLAECGGRHAGEIDWRLARRGDIVEFAGGLLAVCVGQYAVGPDGLLRPMGEALRAWRIR